MSGGSASGNLIRLGRGSTRTGRSPVRCDGRIGCPLPGGHGGHGGGLGGPGRVVSQECDLQFVARRGPKGPAGRHAFGHLPGGQVGQRVVVAVVEPEHEAVLEERRDASGGE